ncbi:MAG: AEC family transporter [Lachnospiraceae bacterium]|nr:AEC family transporter [Lachnospiraceae bacterium]
MSVEIVLTQMLIIFVMMAVGFILMRKGIVNSVGVKQISALVSNVCNPALLLTSAFSEENTATNQEVLMVAAIAFIIFFLLLLVGNVMGRILRAPKDQWNYYCLMTMFGNVGFIGIPLGTAILGNQCLIYIAVFNFMFYIYIYTYGIYLLTKQKGTKEKMNPRVFLNPGTVAAFLTVLIFFLKIPVPTVAAESLDYMGRATVFLAIFVIGTSLAQVSVKEILKEYRLYIFIAIRFILIPIITALVMRMITDDMLILGITVIMTAVPAGNMPLMFAKERDLDADIISKGIILSTVLSLVTIPIVTLFV